MNGVEISECLIFVQISFEENKKPRRIAGALRLSKNCRLIQKEDELQGEKGLEKGASPLFHLK